MKTTRDQRGSALIAALIILMVLGIGVSSVWRAMHQGGEYQRRLERAEYSRQLAEAGIDKAIAALRHGTDYRGENNTVLGDGAFDVRVTSKDAPGHFHVFARGRLGDVHIVRAEYVLDAELELDPHGALRAFRCWTPEK